jgi:hypothetical protein
VTEVPYQQLESSHCQTREAPCQHEDHRPWPWPAMRRLAGAVPSLRKTMRGDVVARLSLAEQHQAFLRTHYSFDPDQPEPKGEL